MHSGVGNCLGCAVDVVVITVHQNQAGAGSASAAFVVVQAVAFLYYVSGQDHSTFCIEAVVTCSEAQVVDLGYPGSLTGYCNCAAFNVVVVLAYLHQTGIVHSSATLVVVQSTILIYHLSGHDHLTVCCKTIGTGSNQIVGLADPSGTVAICGVVPVEVVIVAVDILQAGVLISAVYDIVQVAVIPIQAILNHANQNAVLAELIPLSVGIMAHNNGTSAGAHVGFLEEVGCAVNILPALSVVPGTVEVLCALIGVVPVALYQTAAGHLVGNLHTIDGIGVGALKAFAGLPVEEVVIVADAVPVVLQLANNCIVGLAVHFEQAAILGLADIDAGLAKVVVEAVDILNAGESFAFDVVCEAAVLIDPAFLQDIDQSVFIADLNVGVAEVAACIGGVSRIAVGVHAKHSLAFGLLCKAVQTAGAHVDLIADVAGGHSIDLGNILPDAVLRSELDAVDEAQGICGSLVDHLALLDPVHGHGQSIGGLIKLQVLHFEVLIEDLQLAVIHNEVIIEIDGCLNPGHIADTLRQVQQEAPGGSAFHSAAGQHVGQVLQALRDGDGGHIHCEDVGGDHILGRIDNIVDIAVFDLGVGYLTVPSQHTVAAAGLVKVKAVFALLIQHDIDGCLAVLAERCGNGQGLNGRLCSLEDEAVHSTCSRNAEGDGDIIGVDGNGLACKPRLQRQGHAGAVDHVYLCLFEVQLIGVGNGHQLAADLHAIQHQIYIDLTQTLGDKHTVLGDGCPVFIADCPGCALGNIHSIATGADACSIHLHGSSDGSIVVLALDHSVVECSRAGSGGVDQQVGGNVTGVAVGGTVHNGQLIAAGLTGHEGGGAAAVQVDSNHTASFSHNVAHILQACTGGEGMLTAIDTHNDHTAGSGDTNGGTGGIAVGSAADHLAVLHNEFTEAADCFLNAVLHSSILIVSAHVSSAVIQNCKEACCGALGMPFDAVHNQQTAGSSHIGHIEATSVGGSDNIKVLNVVRAIGIAIAVLGVLSGAGNGIVLPLGILGSAGFAGIVVDPQTHIVTVYVCSSNVEHDLLAVCIGSVADLLGDAGSQDLGLGIKHSVAGVIQVFHIVAGPIAHLVCKCVADSLAQISQLVAGSVEVTGTFQSADELVAGVSVIHSGPQVLADAQAVQAVGQQVADTLLQGQAFLVILTHHSFQITGVVALGDQFVHEVVSFQVSVQVAGAKGTGSACLEIVEQVIFADVLNLLLQGQVCGHTEFISGAQQVSQVTDPAAHISVVLAALVVVGHVHGAKEVATHDANLCSIRSVGVELAVGVFIGLQLLQTGHIDPYFDGRIGVDGVFRLLNELQEVLVLGACHNGPGAGGVVCHSGTHVVEHQGQGILAGVFLSVHLSHHFQIADVGNELIQSFVLLDLYLGNLDIALGILAAEFTGFALVLIQSTNRITQQAVVVGIPANSGVGSSLGLSVHPLVVQYGNGICVIVAVHTVLSAFLVADRVTGCGNGHLRGDPVVVGYGDLFLSNQYFAAVTAVSAFRQAGGGTGGINALVHNHQVLLLGIKVQVAAFPGASGAVALAGIAIAPVVAQCRDHFLGNPELITLLALHTGGHTIGSTGSGNLFCNGNAEVLLANQHIIDGSTQSTSVSHVGRGVTAVVAVGFALVPYVTLGVNGQDLNHGLLTAFVLAGVDDLAFCLTGSGSHFALSCESVVVGIDGCYHGFQNLGSLCVSKVGAAIHTVVVGNHAFLLAGGSHSRNIPQHQVTGCRQFHISGVVAAGAGGISIPTDLGAGGSLCAVDDLIVAQRGNLFLRNEDFVANRAVLAFGQAGFSAGRSNCCIGHFCVAQSRQYPAVFCDLVLTGSIAVVVLTSGAVPVSAVAFLFAGGSLCFGAGHSAFMATCQNGDLGVFVLLCVADGALLVLDTGGQNGCFHIHDPCPGMAESSYLGIGVAVATVRAGVGGVTSLGTSGLGDYGFVVVAQSGGQFSAANSTSLCFLAGSSCPCGMAQSSYLSIGVAVATDRTGVGGVTGLGTGGLGDHGIIAVT